MSLNLKIEFGGGLEILFSNQRSHAISIPAVIPKSTSRSPTEAKREERPADVTFLIHWLKDTLLKEREELFMENGTV